MNAKKPHNQVPKDPEVGLLWPAEAGVSDTSWNLGQEPGKGTQAKFLLGQEPGGEPGGEPCGCSRRLRVASSKSWVASSYTHVLVLAHLLFFFFEVG